MSITTPALTALAALHEACPSSPRDLADEIELSPLGERVAALWDAESHRIARAAGRFAPAFASHTPTQRMHVVSVVRQHTEDLAKAEQAMHAALAAVLSRIESEDTALDVAGIPTDEVARRRTEHHALVRTITDALEGRA